ncbi:unnamed protein product [Boreogadus saida]
MSNKQHPPLMKKHSQTDLVSRLKTRKILGVGGEDDDGEVHRSKSDRAGPWEQHARVCSAARVQRVGQNYGLPLVCHAGDR